jgi:hypothetical protein
LAEFEGYESTELQREVVRSNLFSYLSGRIKEDLPAVGSESYSPGVFRGSQTALVDEFQLSTYVDPEDDRFGYLLGLSPLQLGDDEFISVLALYAKADRERRLLAEEPLWLRLNKTRSASRHTFEESRAVDGDDWRKIYRLQEIAKQRRANPELVTIDSVTKLVAIEGLKGVFDYLATEFGDKKPEESSLTSLETELNEIFEDSNLVLDIDGKKILALSKDEDDCRKIAVVEFDDRDYIVHLLDSPEAAGLRKFAIGPYAKGIMDDEGFVDEILATDLSSLEDFLRNGTKVSFTKLSDVMEFIKNIDSEDYQDNSLAAERDKQFHEIYPVF